MRMLPSDACMCGPVVNMKTADGMRKFEAIANDVADLVLEFGGALSGEHGDGLVRSPFMQKMFGPRFTKPSAPSSGRSIPKEFSIPAKLWTARR